MGQAEEVKDGCCSFLGSSTDVGVKAQILGRKANMTAEDAHFQTVALFKRTSHNREAFL